MSILLNVVLILVVLALLALIWRAHATNVDAWELVKGYVARLLSRFDGGSVPK